jgi:hypothetical protein
MAEGDEKSIVVRTSAEFQAGYRALDERIDVLDAKAEILKRKGDVEAGAAVAVEHTRLIHQINDLVLDEIERHWGPVTLDGDPTVPDFPDDWRTMFFGRLLRLEYNERAAYKRD